MIGPEGYEAVANTNESNNSAKKFYPLAKIPGQIVKNGKSQSSPTNPPKLLDNNIPNDGLFPNPLDGKSNLFIRRF